MKGDSLYFLPVKILIFFKLLSVSSYFPIWAQCRSWRSFGFLEKVFFVTASRFGQLKREVIGEWENTIEAAGNGVRYQTYFRRGFIGTTTESFLANAC